MSLSGQGPSSAPGRYEYPPATSTANTDSPRTRVHPGSVPSGDVLVNVPGYTHTQDRHRIHTDQITRVHPGRSPSMSTRTITQHEHQTDTEEPTPGMPDKARGTIEQSHPGITIELARVPAEKNAIQTGQDVIEAPGSGQVIRGPQRVRYLYCWVRSQSDTGGLTWVLAVHLRMAGVYSDTGQGRTRFHGEYAPARAITRPCTSPLRVLPRSRSGCIRGRPHVDVADPVVTLAVAQAGEPLAVCEDVDLYVCGDIGRASDEVL